MTYHQNVAAFRNISILQNFSITIAEKIRNSHSVRFWLNSTVMVGAACLSVCLQGRPYAFGRPTAIMLAMHSLQLCDCVSNNQGFDCLPNRLFRRISKRTAKLRVTALYEGHPLVTNGLPSQRASNAENDLIWSGVDGLQLAISIGYWCVASELKALRQLYLN